ncbi:hypothetical protein LINPERPRIM_LOCUS33941 [Linum perenne]
MSRILATDVLLLSRVLNLGHHGITMLAHIVSRLLHLTMTHYTSFFYEWANGIIYIIHSIKIGH